MSTASLLSACGWELQEPQGGVVEVSPSDGNCTNNVSIVHTINGHGGASSGLVTAQSGVASYWTLPPLNNALVNVLRFASNWVYFSAFPSTTARVFVGEIAANHVNLRINPDGTIAFYINTTLQGTSATALTLNTWHQIEWDDKSFSTANGDILRIDRIVQLTGFSFLGTPLVRTTKVGATDTVADTFTCYYDDYTLMSQWSSHNVVQMLLPTSDVSRTGWTGGGGGTTNLYDALNNVPPAGVAPGSETNTSSIKYGIDDADALTVQFPSYASLGIPSQFAITGIMAATAAGPHGVNAGSIWLSIEANPAFGLGSSTFRNRDTGGIPINGNAPHGAYPTNWVNQNTPYGVVNIFSKEVDINAGAQVKLRKASNNADFLCDCSCVLFVVWNPLALSSLDDVRATLPNNVSESRYEYSVWPEPPSGGDARWLFSIENVETDEGAILSYVVAADVLTGERVGAAFAPNIRIGAVGTALRVSHDGTWLAVAGIDPGVLFFPVDPDTGAIGDPVAPDVNPGPADIGSFIPFASIGSHPSWSPADDYVFVGQGGGVPIIGYARSGSTFTKIADPATAPPLQLSGRVPTCVEMNHAGTAIIVIQSPESSGDGYSTVQRMIYAYLWTGSAYSTLRIFAVPDDGFGSPSFYLWVGRWNAGDTKFAITDDTGSAYADGPSHAYLMTWAADDFDELTPAPQPFPDPDGAYNPVYDGGPPSWRPGDHNEQLLVPYGAIHFDDSDEPVSLFYDMEPDLFSNMVAYTRPPYNEDDIGQIPDSNSRQEWITETRYVINTLAIA